MARADLSWRTTTQALWLICRGATFRTASRIALVVGTLLTAIHQGAVLASGQTEGATWLRVAANYLIPYVVSSIGYLTPFRMPLSLGAAQPDEGDCPRP
ncbi:MAG: nitrate/nitrite transporter NrtS [Cellulomonas sp.]